MASVYKSISKKKNKKPVEDAEEDVDMGEVYDDTSDSEDDEEESQGDGDQKQEKSGLMPKTRILMLTSRGVTHRYVGMLLEAFLIANVE